MLALTSLCHGQGSTPQRGYQAGGSYALSDIETINVGNGNMMLNLPLGKLPAGRGGLAAQINLHYDSKLYDSHTQWSQDWDHLQQNGDPTTVVRSMLSPTEQGGWHYGVGYSLQVIDRMDQYPSQLKPQYPDESAIYRWKVKVTFPDGSVHEFLPRGFGSEPMHDGYYDIRPDGWQTRWAGGACWPATCIYPEDVPYLTGTLSYYSFDGTYARLEIEHDSNSGPWDNFWTLYLPDGTNVRNGNVINDRNGNFVEITNITYHGNPATQLADQLGRRVVLERASTGDLIHVPGVGGADLVYTVHWKTIQICKTYSTAFNGLDYYGYADMLGTQNVVSEIDLPPESGGLKYLFTYNAYDYGSVSWGTPSNGWGEINSITLPSGAQTQYQYSLDGQNGPGPAYLPESILKSFITRKTLTYQNEYDGSSTSTSETWNYSDNSHEIINPDGGVINALRDMQREYRIEQPDGTVVERIWQGNVPQGFPVIHGYDPMSGYDPYETSRINAFIKTEFTSIKDANGNLTKTAIKDFSFDKNGNLTSVSDYDWVDYGSVPRGGIWGLPTGIPGSAVVKRITANTYHRWTPDAADTSSNATDSYWNSSAPRLRNAVASSELSNGAQILSRAEFTYDDPATTGNLTQQKSWDSTKGAYSNLLTTNSVSVATQYNQYGSPTLTTDARGLQTLITYGNVAGVSDLYPTQVQTAYGTSVQRTETREYDFYTGVVTRATDVDNNVSTSTVYDIFGRPTLVKAAEGKAEETRSSTEYSDVNRRVIVRSDLNSVGDGKLVAIQHYDQLGRIRLTRQLEDSTTQSAADETQGIKVQTRYVVSNPCQPADTAQCLADNSSVLGSYQLVSNPYRAAYSSSAGSEPTMGWTRSRNDKGARVTEVQTFGGAGLPGPWGSNTTTTGTVTTAYNSNFTTVTDQAGKARRSMTDGLGRLARVDEPDGNGSLGATDNPVQPTSYAYDALGNLLTVNQGSQTRSFAYSSLARLLSTTNPESGAISYQYDNNGNLQVKTDARSVSAHYDYDSLNRVVRRWYNSDSSLTATNHNNPAVPSGVGSSDEVKYFYDSQNPPGGPTFDRGYAIGRLVAVTYGSVGSGTYLGYDALGKALRTVQQTGGINYRASATYNLAGALLTETYPSGRTVTNTYDNAGRTTGVSGTLGDGTPRNYATGIIYDAASRMTQEQFGTTTAVFNKLFYNSRGQLAEILAATSGNDTSFNRGKIVNDYSEQCSGFGCNGSDNNGNLRKQTVLVPNNEQNTSPTSWNQQYAYDSLNRLTQVHEYTGNTNLDWQQTYSYDRYGNRTIDYNNTTSTIPRPQFNVNPSTNRLTVPNGYSGTMSYDNAGNLTTDTYSAGAVTRVYDAENRMTSETQANNYVAGSYSYDGDGRRVKRIVNGTETWQVYGLGGELIAEYAANAAAANPQKEYAYRNGQMLFEAEVPAGSGGNAPTFTDDPLQAQVTEIKAVHLTQLRDAVDLLRARAGLAVETWTPDSNIQQTVTEVKAQHVLKLREKLEPALIALRLPHGGYAHPGLGVGSVIYAIDFQELRTQMKAAWLLKMNWLVTDQLGTPRMIFDQSGSLANVSRHDYLPFGEELFANTGGRTTQHGYTLSDNVRQKFTSKERDNETGLDFFGARYHASTQGRFTSSDPLLASGTVYDPQSWNRYSYASNNPLRFVDPTGMWDWDASAGGSDTKEQLEAKRDNKSLKKKERNAAKNALEFRERFLAAMSQGADAVGNSNLTAEQKTQVLAAMNSYGTENDGNGVKVGVAGHLASGEAANTLLKDDGTISVTFLSGHKGKGLIIEIAHEGQHVGDADAFLASGAKANESTDLTHRDREIRGYTITSMVAQALGVSSAVKGFEGRDQIWNSNWKKADQATIDSRRAQRVERFVGTPSVGYPANAPGDRYSQEFRLNH